MKKSIKYAGIAAATLLAVAPVVSTTVNADTTTIRPKTATGSEGKANGYASNATVLTSSLNVLNGKFSGTREANEASKNPLLGKVVLGDGTKLTYANFMSSETANFIANNQSADTINLDKTYNVNNDTFTTDKVLGDKTKKDANVEGSYAGANVRDMYVTATATYANNQTKTLNTNAELTNAVKDETVTNIALTTHYTYTDTNNDDQTGSTTLNLKNTNMAMTKLNVSFTTPYNVALDQTISDSQLIDGTDFKMTDQDGKAVLSNYAKPGDTYYTSAQSALTNDKTTGKASASDVELTSTSTSNSGQVFAPKFKTAGNYYQAITVNVGSHTRAKAFMDSIIANPGVNTLTINGVQFSDINTDNFKYEVSTGTLTFARKIVVSNDASQWTYTKQSGVVTTKSASNYYTLVNNENQPVGNRALGKDSAWLTDQYRVNNNGVKQYRVATGEWIDANNVTFSDKATTPSDNSALTDIQNQNGTVTLDAPASFNYLLYTKSGELGNRALSGDSAWKVIQTAKDSKGRTYYRVSTTEWVMEGNGVHFTAE